MSRNHSIAHPALGISCPTGYCSWGSAGIEPATLKTVEKGISTPCQGHFDPVRQSNHHFIDDFLDLTGSEWPFWSIFDDFLKKSMKSSISRGRTPPDKHFFIDFSLKKVKKSSKNSILVGKSREIIDLLMKKGSLTPPDPWNTGGILPIGDRSLAICRKQLATTGSDRISKNPIAANVTMERRNPQDSVYLVEGVVYYTTLPSRDYSEYPIWSG